MIRRNLLGQFFTAMIFLCLVGLAFVIGRYFDFSADWADGPLLPKTSLLAVQMIVCLMAVIAGFYSFVGQVASKARRYSGFAVFILFCTWMLIVLMLLVAFFDKLFNPEIKGFGALQQVAACILGIGVFAGTWLYTIIKFPEYKDVEYVKDYIKEEVEKAVYKPDLSCEKCGEGLKEGWEFCPGCGGMVLDDDSVVLSDYEVIVEEEPEFAAPPPVEDAPRKKKGLFGRLKGKRKEEEPKEDFVLDEDEPDLDEVPDKEEAPPDEDFIDEFEQEPKEKKASKKKTSGVVRVKCENPDCETLLEIRNPKRPLHVRCPTCKHIWELKE